MIELIYLFYCDWEEQQNPANVLRFLVHSYNYTHLMTTLFGDEILKETYLHKLYVQDHLPGTTSNF
jgi:hypothetical protein